MLLLGRKTKAKLNGVAAGGRLLKLPSNTRRRLRNLDWSYRMLRKQSPEPFHQFLADLEAEIDATFSAKVNCCPQPLLSLMLGLLILSLR